MFKSFTQLAAGAGGLIALFLVLSHSSDFNTIANGAAQGAVSLTTALQGRS